MSERQATYQAEWSLLAAGIAEARLELHRIRHHLHRARRLVDESDHKEDIYQVAGDILTAVPRRWDKLESLLDRTAYALMVLGAGNYRDRLPMDDRALVDDADHKAKSLRASEVAARYLTGNKSAENIASKWLEARAFNPLPEDLSQWIPGQPQLREPEPQPHTVNSDPQIGWPGGPCHLVRRIHYRIRNPRLREQMADVVEYQGKLDKNHEKHLYKTVAIPGVGSIKKIYLVPHAQHRMDQRTIVTHDIQITIGDWLKEYNLGRQLRGQNVRKPKLREAQANYETWRRESKARQPIEYLDPRTRIFVVFQVNLDRDDKPDGAKIITAYWLGVSDPRPPGGDSCRV